MTADQLLRGYTPVMATFEPLKELKKKKINTVAVARGDSENNGDNGRKFSVRPTDGRTVEDKVEAKRTHFCANAMILLTITESAAILCSSVYWLVETINPSGVGITVGKLPSNVVLLNLLIMVVGEW